MECLRLVSYCKLMQACRLLSQLVTRLHFVISIEALNLPFLDMLDDVEEVNSLMLTFSDFMTQGAPISKVGSVAKYANIEKYVDFLMTRTPLKFPV